MIDGNDLEKDGITETQQQVVRAHTWMLTALLRPHAKALINEIAPLAKGWGGNGDVIDAAGHGNALMVGAAIAKAISSGDMESRPSLIGSSKLIIGEDFSGQVVDHDGAVEIRN